MSDKAAPTPVEPPLWLQTLVAFMTLVAMVAFISALFALMLWLLSAASDDPKTLFECVKTVFQFFARLRLW